MEEERRKFGGKERNTENTSEDEPTCGCGDGVHSDFQ